MLLSLAVTAEAAARQESSPRQLSVSPTAEVATRQCTESDLYAGWPRVHHDPLYASARPNPLESLLGCAVVDLEHASLSQDEILTLAREVATNGTVVAGLTRLRLGSVGNTGNAGASAVADVLRASSTLQQLDLGHAQVGAAGAAALGEAALAETAARLEKAARVDALG